MSEGAGGVAPRPLLPPYHVYRGFLDSDTHAGLLAWAIENEAMFEPTKVGNDGKRDPSRRMSLGVVDFGPMKALLRQRLLDLAPALIRDLRVTPFEPSKVTLELVAHNDSAFFKRHIDTFVGDERLTSDRLLSAVYYFHIEPKALGRGVASLPVRREGRREQLRRRAARAKHASRIPVMGVARGAPGQLPIKALF